MVNISKAALVLVLVALAFSAGWLASSTYTTFATLDIQKPADILGLNSEKDSPSDRIKESDVKLGDNKIVIFVDEPFMARFTDTHSMEPVLHSTSTGIEVTPKSADEIVVGDIISYESKYDGVIIHRVIDIGNDDLGWYAITKGDNNPLADQEKVRFEHVQRILVGILY